MKLFGSYKESKYDKRPSTASSRNVQGVKRDDPISAPAQQEPERQTGAALQAAEPAPIRIVTVQESAGKKRRKSKKKKHRQRVIAFWIILALLVSSYFAIFWIPWVQKGADGQLHQSTIFGRLQHYLISNSRESHSYQWVQYAYPWYIRQIYIDAEIEARAAQNNFNSEKDPEQIHVTDPINGEPSSEPSGSAAEEMPADKVKFYELFWELDYDSMEAYLEKHPSVLKDGYANIYINEAGLDDEGTSIYTTKGEQVLAIDAYNGVLLVRITGDTYRGVLATAKDPSRLHLYVSDGISNSSFYQGYGQTAGTIARNHNGILAISGSGFTDEGGVGTGGAVAGFCRSDGVDYGWRHREWGCKRLELRENNWLYLTDSQTDCRSDVTNAMEFEPGMIADGQRQPNYVYTSENPRACLGQNDYGEILFLAIEGRQPPITGCSVSVCTDILLDHRCITAMNMDGGTSAMLWFDGEPVIRCSNANTPEGRYLPNAWVYVRKD